MKVLFDVDHAFSWAHGGVQVLVEHLMAELPRIGIEAEPLRWWDASQRGDILHLFYPPTTVIRYARRKGLRIVSNLLLDYLSSNSALTLAAKRAFIRGFTRALPRQADALGWRYGEIAHACIYPSELEAQLGTRIFGVPNEKGHVILHGVPGSYFGGGRRERQAFLVSVGTIQERKQSVFLAEVAKQAQVPIVFVGKPYDEGKYFQRFRAQIDGKLLQYRSYLDDDQKVELLRTARGFVLLSTGESGCIAALEALAAGCPLFLPDLPWAHSVYDGAATFGDVRSSARLADELRRFFQNPPPVPSDFEVPTWATAAKRYRDVYIQALALPADS